MRAKAASAVVPLAMLNIGTSPVKSALNVTIIEKSLEKPSINRNQQLEKILVNLHYYIHITNKSKPTTVYKIILQFTTISLSIHKAHNYQKSV